MKLKKKKYTWSKRIEIAFLPFLFWTSVIILSFFWNTYQAEEQILLLADKEAKVNLERDLAFRRWATSHGGLYVPVSEKAKPNPHLQVEERDVKTPSGKTLTLYNPATMLREIKKSQEELSGAVTRITALQILNPVNAPDEWEKKALKIIQETKADYTEYTQINGKPYLRKMQPMFMEEGCMKCHAWTGLKVGEIRGATDYSVPLGPYYKIFQNSKVKMFFSHLGIWTFGLGIIFYLARRSRKLEVELEESDRTIISISRVITKIVDNSPVGILLYEADTGKCIITNQAVANIVGSTIDNLLQQNYLETESWKNSGLLEVAQKSLKTKENTKGEFNFKTTFGKNIWVECIFSSFESQNVPHLLLMMTDISDRKKSDLELRKLLTAIEQSPTSIVISDIEANILYANPKFSEVTGYTVEDILGKNPKLLHSGFTPQSVYNDLWDTLTQGKNWSGEFVNQRKNGEIFYEQAFIAPVKDMEGKISYYVAVKLDITERKKMELALIKSKEEAEKANKAKSDFLATMSHEIRTPIHGILGLNEILLDSDPRIDQIAQLKTIAESGQNLLDIISNILNIAELEKNYIPLVISEFSLKNFLNETCNYYRLKLKHNNIFLICEFSGDLVDLISTDKRRLEQIIHNLMDNAIKFTEEGTIVVYVKSELVTGDNYRLTFRVADTGKGISDDYKEKIFELFSQEDTSVTRKYGGIGLGLAICKKLTSLLGGEIFVESKLGKGSKFTFTIICKLGQMKKQEVVATSNSVSLSQLKILIVEDDVINMMIIQQQLRSLGCKQIETALDGGIALSKIESKDFDLVLTDLHMPNMDGFELAENIKKILNRHPKIIAITADAYEETRQRCYSLGMANFLTKPFSKDQLEKTIKDILLN